MELFDQFILRIIKEYNQCQELGRTVKVVTLAYQNVAIYPEDDGSWTCFFVGLGKFNFNKEGNSLKIEIGLYRYNIYTIEEYIKISESEELIKILKDM